MAVILGYLSYVDIKKREVPDLWVLALFLYSFFVVKDYKTAIFTGLYTFLVLIAVSLVTRGSIGGGDIKLLSVMAYMMGNNFYVIMLCSMSFMAIGFIFNIVKYRDLKVQVPMVPYIFAGYITWLGGVIWLKGL